MSKNITAWERVEIARSPKRKTAIEYIENIFDEFIELHGDRSFKDDKAIVCGLARIGMQNFTIIAEADAAIENMALSASIATHNTWQRATDTIRQGRVTALQHQAQAEQYTLAAKATRDSMLYTGLAGAIGAAAGAVAQGYANTADINNTLYQAYQDGQLTEKDYLSTLQSGITWDSNMLTAAYQGLNTAAGAANAFNPWTATMTPAANNRKNNWGANLSVLLGRTPYTTPQAGNLFPGI